MTGKPLILRYKGRIPAIEGLDLDTRLYDVLSPLLPGYDYTIGYPTFTINGLKERGLL